MRALRILLAGSSLGFCAAARAVYAPIPEEEQGKDFSLSLMSGISYNTNIFGASSGAVGSFDFVVSPKIVFNASVSDQTFLSATFQPSLDYFPSRPGTKDLYSQVVNARVAHSFSKTSVLDMTDAFSYDQNPEALLNGLPVNTDQTLLSNQFDGRYSFAPMENLGMVLKTRSVYFDYINPLLSSELNRFENLYGMEFDYRLLPDVKIAGEYRHQDVDYQHDPDNNNKHSDFLMAGFDYNAGPQLTASVRVGAEYRHREGGLPDETTPYAELSLKYDYAKGSYVSVGYTYDIEETSDPIIFSDENVNKIFANIQHTFTPLIVGSASIDYEPATLNGLPARNGQPAQVNIKEDSTHGGVALTYLPAKNWRLVASYDYDLVDSDLSDRGLNRSRVGVSATVNF
jgi:Putative beta-barrel porin 2